ncbi:putative DNA methylase N-4/N-6 domain protein [Burkholderia plantarii]|uniref:site-specific DNA-methyltransferase (cytosine-N(4)-specific) n=2 Tax=Burkholderia plantarii TaxID=41899 RepID=A0A0B6S4X9_BURPL|nr:putative DNA methylase N-4/N-6 domain protein [Burkholderia plantarii]
MQMRTVHPFPARMAPELALNSLASLRAGSTVLDPMAGSGTVLRQALSMGHNAVGFDMDPLAVLMSRVWTSGVDGAVVHRELDSLLVESKTVDLRSDRLSWHDDETQEFVRYWFGDSQRRALTRLAVVMDRRRHSLRSVAQKAALDVLQVALSRIIVTKEQCASLARDTSHSRPHRVTLSSDYNVVEGFKRSVTQLVARLEGNQQLSQRAGSVRVSLGDARAISLEDGSVDAIMTSPPYLNAIDYMRGHRLSLVWLGHAISALRVIRSNTVGAERSYDKEGEKAEEIALAMCDLERLTPKHQKMVIRYAGDLERMMRQAVRVLRIDGTATYVLGNSCLKDTFIRNSEGVSRAGALAGLDLVNVAERELPSASRYLPVTRTGSLSKRMRTETILTFCRRS